MNRNKYKQVQIRPHEARCIKLLEVEFINPSYKLEFCNSAKAGETGLLKLFSLKSKDGALPSFDARWDIKQDSIDVDLLGPKNLSKQFKSQTGGYRGHQNKRLGDHSYHIDIALPDADVFRGTIELDANGIISFQEELKLKITDSLRIFNADTDEEIKIN